MTTPDLNDQHTPIAELCEQLKDHPMVSVRGLIIKLEHAQDLMTESNKESEVGKKYQLYMQAIAIWRTTARAVLDILKPPFTSLSMLTMEAAQSLGLHDHEAQADDIEALNDYLQSAYDIGRSTERASDTGADDHLKDPT